MLSRKIDRVGKQLCYGCSTPHRETADHCRTCGRLLRLRDGKRVYLIRRAFPASHFSTVYEAVDTSVANRHCAIKVLVEESPDDAQQIANEVDILAHVRLPFVPAIYSYWRAGSRHHIVMEYVTGETLDQAAPRPWQPAAVVEMLRCLLGYLVQLHARDIIHNDIKPANIKRNDEGVYRLLDFNVAGRTAHDKSDSIAARGFTQGFAPPEQIRFGKSSTRSDLYSLAATAYYVLFDETPRPGATLPDHLPAPLRSALELMLHADPDTRPPDAATALRLLEPLVAQSGLSQSYRRMPTSRMDADNVAGTHPEPQHERDRKGAGRALTIRWRGTGDDTQLIVGTSLGIVVYAAPIGENVRFPIQPLRTRVETIAVRPENGLITFVAGQTVYTCERNDRIEQLLTFDQGDDRCYTLSPDGCWAACRSGATLQVWALDGSGMHYRMPLPPTSTQFALGNHSLAIAYDEGVLFLRLIDSERIGMLQQQQPVTALAARPSDGRFAVATHATVQIWTPETTANPLSHDLDIGCIRVITFDPVGQCVALASAQQAAIWSLGDDQPVVLPQLPAPITDLAFAPDGTILAIIAADTIWCYRLRDNRLIRGPASHYGPLRSLTVSHTSGLVVSYDHAMRVWQAIATRLQEQTPVHPFPAASAVLAASPAGDTLALSSIDGVCILRSIECADWQVLATLATRPSAAAFVDSDHLTVITATALERWTSAGTPQIERRHPISPCATAALSADGQVAATIDAGSLRVWQVEAGTLLWERQLRDADVELALAVDGTVIALVADRQIELWRIGGATPFATAACVCQALAFAPTGDLLATVSGSGIQIWRIEETALSSYRTLEGHTEPISGVAFLPHGCLVSASWDGSLRLWSVV